MAKTLRYYLRPGERISDLWKRTADAILNTNKYAVVKPQRSLGAPWMDDFVSRRRNISLCSGCQSRYGDWWRKVHYRADWAGWLSDCDGCSDFTTCNGFYPEENIAGVLNRKFWDKDYKPDPNMKRISRTLVLPTRRK